MKAAGEKCVLLRTSINSSSEKNSFIPPPHLPKKEQGFSLNTIHLNSLQAKGTLLIGNNMRRRGQVPRVRPLFR